jgi:hypothetical protein
MMSTERLVRREMFNCTSKKKLTQLGLLKELRVSMLGPPEGCTVRRCERRWVSADAQETSSRLGARLDKVVETLCDAAGAVFKPPVTGMRR